MWTASNRIATALIMLSAVSIAHSNDLKDTLLNMQSDLEKQCKCASISTCQEYVDCVDETSCPQIFVDHKQALKLVKCDQKKFEAVGCGVAVHMLGIAIYSMRNEVEISEEYSCLTGATKGDWTCTDFKKDGACLKKFINLIFEGKCDIISEVIQEGLCSGKSIEESLYSKNVAQFVNKKFGV